VTLSNRIIAGLNSDVLIHEATFETEMRDDAIAKAHSTSDEALEIGRRMNAKLTVLTHFSQRYPKIQPPQQSSSPSTSGYTNAAIAFDLMTISSNSDYSILSLLIPCIQQLFKEDDSNEDEDEATPHGSSSSKQQQKQKQPQPVKKKQKIEGQQSQSEQQQQKQEQLQKWRELQLKRQQQLEQQNDKNKAT